MPPPIRRSIACLEGNTPTTYDCAFWIYLFIHLTEMLKACAYKVWFCLLASVFVAIAITVVRLVICPASSSSTCSTITIFTTSPISVRAIPLTVLLLHHWGASLTPLFGTRLFTGGFWKQNACLVVFSRQFGRLVMNQITRKHPVWYQTVVSYEKHN